MTTTLQHVIFPLDRDPDILPLYADPETWTTIGQETVRVSASAHADDILSRSSARIPAGRRVSFASYFNAFPASYWQHWTVVESVDLHVSTVGAGTVIVYRSNASGVPQRVESASVSGEATTSFALPLASFGDGGWYWFDIVADDGDVVLAEGSWTTEQEPRTAGGVSLGITTFNKPDYCVKTLATLADEARLLEDVDRIYVVDQGTQLVEDREEYDGLKERLGDTLQIVRQKNLGGSGGFSRAMLETSEAGVSDFVLLLDDDVEVEPEGIRRSLQFSRFTRKPTIVGGHMFDLLDKPILHAFAETVDPYIFLWRPLFDEQIRHDFRKTNLRQTPWMHMRMDADYNGWWMCMIPVSVVKEIGLALPVFIKWDDSEFGLRAKAAGVRTVSLPGSALWHVSWGDKDDAQDWQAYFHARNRIVAGLIHSPFSRGGRLPSNSRRLDLKHLLSMQYYAVELRHRALRDVLSGPGHLHDTMHTRMPELRAKAAEHSETRIITSPADAPDTKHGKLVYPPVAEAPPMGKRLAIFTAKAAARHLAKPTHGSDADAPDVELAKRDATWWRVPSFDSALISTADGRGKSVYRRDRGRFRRLWRESLRLHGELEQRWASLAEQYRRELPEYTSPDAWRRSFERD